MPGGGKKKNKNKGPKGGEENGEELGHNGLAPEQIQQLLLPLIQKKMNSLVGTSSGYFETLPKPVQNRVKALKNIQEKKKVLDVEYKKELAALEQKYRDLHLPLYSRRSEIVLGKSEPTAEELVEPVKKEEETKEEKKEEKPDSKEQTKPIEKSDIPEDAKGIPNFWLTVLKTHPELAETIEEADEEALNYLQDITVKPVGDKASASFALEFHFAENPFFEEKLLTKSYFLEENELYGEVMFDHMESTEITWKAEKNLTVKVVTKQQKVGGKRGGKGKGGRGGKNQPQTRTVTVEEPCPSFFSFFSSEMPGIGEDEDDEELQDEIQMRLEEDYDFGLAIKTQLIPNAVLWYTGEILPKQEDGEDDEEGDEEDEEGEYKSDEDPDFEPKQLPPGAEPKCENQVQ